MKEEVRQLKDYNMKLQTEEAKEMGDAEGIDREGGEEAEEAKRQRRKK